MGSSKLLIDWRITASAMLTSQEAEPSRHGALRYLGQLALFTCFFSHMSPKAQSRGGDMLPTSTRNFFTRPLRA